MTVAGAGPPSTRKGYAAVSGKAANGGRRAAAPTALSPDRIPVGAAPLGGPFLVGTLHIFHKK